MLRSTGLVIFGIIGGISFENDKNHERRNICGKRLREIRKSRELSQENVAAMIQLEGLDLTQKAISRMEAGKRLMTDYELKYLADALGVSIPELFENEPEMNSKK